MIKYLGRLRRMEEMRLTERLYDVSRKENLPWWKEMKDMLRRYGKEEWIDEDATMTDGKRVREELGVQAEVGRRSE